MRGVQLGEHEGNVVVAAVVGHKHAGPPGGDVLPPGDGDGHARHGQQVPGPVGHILGGQGIAHGVVAPLLGGKALVQHGPGKEQVAPEINEPDDGAHGGTPSVTSRFFDDCGQETPGRQETGLYTVCIKLENFAKRQNRRRRAACTRLPAANAERPKKRRIFYYSMSCQKEKGSGRGFAASARVQMRLARRLLLKGRTAPAANTPPG